MSQSSILYCYHCYNTDSLFITDCLHVICDQCRIENRCAVCKRKTTHKRVDNGIREQLLMEIDDVLKLFAFQKSQMLGKIIKLERNEKMYKILIEKCRKRITQQKILIDKKKHSLLNCHDDSNYKKMRLERFRSQETKGTIHVPKDSPIKYDCTRQRTRANKHIYRKKSLNTVPESYLRNHSNECRDPEGYKRNQREDGAISVSHTNFHNKERRETSCKKIREGRSRRDRTTMCDRQGKNHLKKRSFLLADMIETDHNIPIKRGSHKDRKNQRPSPSYSGSFMSKSILNHKDKKSGNDNPTFLPSVRYRPRRKYSPLATNQPNSSPNESHIFHGYSEELRRNSTNPSDRLTLKDRPIPSSKCSLLHRLARRKNEVIRGRESRVSMGIVWKRHDKR